MSRIKTIVELIDPVDTLLDIGTDHGRVIIEAFKQNKIKKAIGTDINAQPLQSAYNNLKEAKVLKKTTLLQTDGFFNINEPYDAVIITGMGFNTIKNILLIPHQKVQYYIFGVQRELKEFRTFLTTHEFKIIDEAIYYNKLDYVFIKAIKGKQTLSKEDILLGPILKTKKEALPYFKKEYKHLKNIYNLSQNEEILDDIDIYKYVIIQLIV